MKGGGGEIQPYEMSNSTTRYNHYGREISKLPAFTLNPLRALHFPYADLGSSSPEGCMLWWLR